MNEFYLTIPSDTTPQFPNNTLTHFTINIDPPIHLSNFNYKVALSEIHFQNNFHILSKKSERVINWRYFNSQKPYRLYIPEIIYSDIHDVIKQINKVIREIEYREANKRNRKPNPIFLKYNTDKENKLFITLQSEKINFDSKEQRLELTSTLAELLGFETDTTYQIEPKKDKTFTTGIKKPSLFSKPCFIHVLINIIETEYVNNKKIKLLRQLTITQPIGDYVNIILTNLYYKKITHNDISLINIQLLNPEGNYLPIQGGQTLVTLHFKEY